MKKSYKIFISILFIIFILYMLLYFFPLSFKYKFLYYTDKETNKENNIFYGNEVARYNGKRRTGFILETLEGTYFIYNNKLMLMNKDKIKEAYTSSSLLYGLGKIGENIYFSDDSCTYKVNVDGVSQLIKYKEGIPEIRIMDNAIYSFEGDKVNKYNKNGKKIFEGNIQTSDSDYVGGIKYMFIKNSHVLVNNLGNMYILKPYYYLFNKKKVEYLSIPYVADKKYYINSQTTNDNNSEYIYFENYFLNRMNKEDREIYDKNKYRLTGITTWAYSVWDIRSGQIYNDKFYFITRLHGFFSESHKEVSDKSFFVGSNDAIFLCSMKLDLNTNNSRWYDYENDKVDVDFDILYNGIGKVNQIGSMQIKDGNMYFIVVKEEGNYLCRMNLTSNNIEELHHFDFSSNMYLCTEDMHLRTIDMYISQEWNFFYIDFYDESTDKLKTAILRLDNNGKNPVLVMNTEGEVVMKPLETDK